MKVSECNGYDHRFPENFTWGHVDSIKFSELGSWLTNLIYHDLKTTERNLTPGLRVALNEIAKRCEI